MQFLTKRSLKGLSTAGGGSARRKRVDPFAAIETRRIAYAGRARSQTALGQVRFPEYTMTSPELKITPEGKFEWTGLEFKPTERTPAPPPTPATSVEAFGQKIITIIQMHPKESLAIAAFGFVLGSIIKKVLRGFFKPETMGRKPAKKKPKAVPEGELSELPTWIMEA